MTLITAALVFLAIVRSNAFEFWDPAEDFPQLNTYFDNSFIGNSFSQLQENYPNLVKTSSLGKTPRDNDINEVTITSNVSHWQTANKPSVKYVANMHGNEIRGRGFLLKLAHYLTMKYKYDPDVKEIMDTTVFHLLPTINPDGFAGAARSCSGVTGRYTSDGTDMNRDFPSHWFDGTRLKFADETKMIMNYAKKVPAVLGISFHDGALVTNYPWDGEPNIISGKYAASPDDALFIDMAKTYSLNHKSMYKTSAQCGGDGFRDGITNGNKWYKVFNGMQDWNYYYNDCFEVTIELGCCKYPNDAASTFGDVWSDNFNSIFAFTKLANYGIKGRVTDFKGNPITGVTITVSGVNKTITVRHPEGYFWRPLVEGTYNISASKHSYYSLSRRNVVVKKSESTVVSFILISKPQDNSEDEENSSSEDDNSDREDDNENVDDNENMNDNENVDDNDSGDVGEGGDGNEGGGDREDEGDKTWPIVVVDPKEDDDGWSHGEDTDETENENQMPGTMSTDLPPPIRRKFSQPHSYSLPLTTTSSPFSPTELYSSPFTTVIIDTVLRHDEGAQDNRIDNETENEDEENDADPETDNPVNYSSNTNSSAIVIALLLSAVYVLC